MGLRNSAAALAATLLDVFRTRMELFGLELAEVRLRVVKMLGMFFAAVFLLALALLVFSLWFAMLFWQTEYRYVALGGLAGVYALAGLFLIYKLRRDLVDGDAPFAATLEELARDAMTLRDLGTQVEAAERSLATRRQEDRS